MITSYIVSVLLPIPLYRNLASEEINNIERNMHNFEVLLGGPLQLCVCGPDLQVSAQVDGAAVFLI